MNGKAIAKGPSTKNQDAQSPVMPSSPGILAQLAELDDLPTPELKARWRELYEQEPPRFNRQFLIKRLAHRIQEIAYGGLPQETRDRMNQLLDAEGYDELGVKRSGKRRADPRPIPGTVLLREWDGQTHKVTVLDEGFEYAGLPYRSLSAIARKITGTQWNGPAFFGMRGAKVKG